MNSDEEVIYIGTQLERGQCGGYINILGNETIIF